MAWGCCQMESLEVAWPHVFWFKVLVLRRMLVYHTFCKIIPERILPKDVTMSSFRIYFSIFPYVFLLDVHAFGFCFISYFARGVSQTCTVVEIKNRFVVTFSTFLKDAAFSICKVWLHSTLLRIWPQYHMMDMMGPREPELWDRSPRTLDVRNICLVPELIRKYISHYFAIIYWDIW